MKNGIKTLAMWLIIGIIFIVVLSSIVENSNSKLKYNYYESVTGKFLVDDWFDVYKINREGEVIVGREKTYSELKKIIEMFKVSHDERLLSNFPYNYGCISKEGKLSIPIIYDSLEFANESACIGTIVNDNISKGYIDILKGEQITPIVFDLCEPFIDGKALVKFRYEDEERYISRDKIMIDPLNGEEYLQEEQIKRKN